MLPLTDDLRQQQKIMFEKRDTSGHDVSLFGAFSDREAVRYSLSLPRKFGIISVVMRLHRDGEAEKDYPFSFCDSKIGIDKYELTLPPLSVGLYYFDLLFLRGNDTLFSNTDDNLHFSFVRQRGKQFRLLIYKSDFHTPEWFHGEIMYHIFLDRFCRGKGTASLHDGAVLNEDWDNGIPVFANKNGDKLDNTVFFGGNLWGVIEKLDYLQSLGVTVLYLSPIFEAESNHRYDTGNYEVIDSLLGGEEALKKLLEEAHRRDMKVILDGVFNHTGSNSLYFNKKGTYPSLGAYQGKESAYYDWYTFTDFPDRYLCWWDIDILPKLNGNNAKVEDYFVGEKGICSRWLKYGIDGWRLDVADELSDSFLNRLRENAKQIKDALMIGEVWENASDKIAYGKRRKYFQGAQLDSVMNYPFREAVLALLLEKNTHRFSDLLTEIYASYPKTVSDSLMNVLGTHDTERILTVLGDDGEGKNRSNRELSQKRLTPKQKENAIKKLKIASLIQFTVYGVPSVYYGDEVGMEGYHDPFCRMPFPWNNMNAELLSHYRYLAELRKNNPCLKDGTFEILSVTDSVVIYRRKKGKNALTVSIDVDNMEYRIK